MVKTLHDGRRVAGDSEEWRAECEARTILRMPMNDRLRYFQQVQAKRGAGPERALRNLVQRIWIDRTAKDLHAIQNQDDVEYRLAKIAANGGQGERLREAVEARMREIISTTMEAA